MADPREKAYYDYIGKRDVNQLFPMDDGRSLDQRRAQAQRLREMGVHSATPKAKPAE